MEWSGFAPQIYIPRTTTMGMERGRGISPVSQRCENWL